uniref:Putative hydroxypyruvate isomerase n=1 Tax=Glossina morsitans morsitans TaxID=37546 RepID=A0A1B0GDY5_GLOMM
MVLKFAANLNFLFTECSTTIAERIYLAKSAGFRAVEIPFPRCEEGQVLEAKKQTGVEIALINIALDPDRHKFGDASIPGEQELFKKHLCDTINIAKQLHCPKIHIMSGLMKDQSFEKHFSTYQDNLKYAVKELERNNLMGLIEPINNYSVPSYFMNNYDIAREILNNFNKKHLKLMLDIFHLQQICGNVTHTLDELKGLIGHVQIAQVPNRHEPDVIGELNFEYVFELIEKANYNDWIGCEYKPKTTTIEGLKWLQKYGHQL